MDWEQWFCPNSGCAGWEWAARHDATQAGVWWLVAQGEHTPRMVVGLDPICPLCSAALFGILELGDGQPETVVVEAKPALYPSLLLV